jgi:pyruvate-formate lyase-activating enzyme
LPRQFSIYLLREIEMRLKWDRRTYGSDVVAAIELYLIKPTRYDDDGYPLQWRWSLVPSNSLACVAGLARDALARGVLDRFGEARLTNIDEINTYVDVTAIIAAAKVRKVLVFLVGVQTNQFPRAMDIARPLRAAEIPVCVGGFHVSGCLSMLKTLPPDLVEAQALGVSFFAGEAEDRRLDEVLLDGFSGELKPIYNHLANTPNLAGEPVPLLDKSEIEKHSILFSSFDLGRGCPFECSFCTIINVQGRKSRFRTPDDLERIVRENAKIGVFRFFVTDDNFARNKHWELLLDRLIALRAENLCVHLTLQVDTMSYKIPRFVEKLHLAGGGHIFIGLENINSDNLEGTKKRQNRVEDYREMILAWKRQHFVVTCGYIIGFPNDTKESLLRDVETIKRDLAIDNIYLNYLTPLPGSEDHKKLYEAGVWMDPDMNKYTLTHRVSHHPVMSDADWEWVYREFHARYYTFAHMETILRRMVAVGSTRRITTINRLVAYREAVRAEGVSMLESGYVRMRRRRQRRSGMKSENPWVFYPWHWFKTLRGISAYVSTSLRLWLILRRIDADPKRFEYRDAALTVTRDDALVASTRVTDYARRRIANSARARAEAEG